MTTSHTRILILLAAVSGFFSYPLAQAAETAQPHPVEYRLLATRRTSTMEKEMNEAAAQGYRFAAAMGGETAFGGSEAVVIMMRQTDNVSGDHAEYRLLATRKTSTMQTELSRAAEDGFVYRDQTVFSTTFGGEEVVVVMERDPSRQQGRYEYRLLATTQTSTMQKELDEIGQHGFSLVGLVLGETSFAGKELIAIMARRRE